MKNTQLLLAVMVLFCSCSKGTAPEESHLGKWKLMNIALAHRYNNGILFQQPILDFSKDSIVFEFKKDNILMVSEDIMSHTALNQIAEHGVPSFFSQFQKGTNVYSIEYRGITLALKTENLTFDLLISNNGSKMKLGVIGAGGYHLEKVEK